MTELRSRAVIDKGVDAAPLPLGGLLGLLLLARLALAATFPLANDEAYYWDWARAPALSYLDHPPGVSAVAWLGVRIVRFFGGAFGIDVASEPLGPRFLAPFLHLGATVFILGTARALKGGNLARRELIFLLVATQCAPGLSLVGAVLLPDVGLIFAATAALFWATLRVRRPAPLGLVDGIVFGCLCDSPGFSSITRLLWRWGSASASSGNGEKTAFHRCYCSLWPLPRGLWRRRRRCGFGMRPTVSPRSNSRATTVLADLTCNWCRCCGPYWVN